MNRKETTRFLSNLLISDRLTNKRGVYYASEVSLDYGTTDAKRVDFMQFKPNGVTCVSDIEKGIFICYEIKSCKEDVYSGNGMNFVGEKNYIVTTMDCYKKLQADMHSGKLWNHITDCCPESNLHVGFMVPIPFRAKIDDEYDNPTELNNETSWELKIVFPCHEGHRRRSTTELLFCMLRSGH